MIRPSQLSGLIAVGAVLVAASGSQARAWRPFVTPQGRFITWPVGPPPVVLRPGWPGEHDDADVLAAIERSAETWNAEACGPTPFDVQGFDTGARLDDRDGRTSVVWYDDEAAWDARFGTLELARTILVYRVASGALLDTDIAVNTARYTFSTDEACDPERYDLQAVMTHELGHALGLDHTAEEAATMFEVTDPGVCGIRDLHADDREGLCALYPPPPPDPVDPVDPADPVQPADPAEPGPEPAPERVADGPIAEPVEPEPSPGGGCGAAGQGGALAFGALTLLGLRRLRRGPRASGRCRR